MSLLYKLIKKTSQEKGKKVKVVSDYDDVIQAHKPFALYCITNSKIPFEDYFKNFWDEVEFTWIHGGSKRKINHSSCIFDELKDEDYERLGIEKDKFEKIKKDKDSFALLKSFKRSSDTFYYEAPFLSIAKELLQCLKEDLISELVIVSGFRKGRYPKEGDPRKLERFKQTFGNFPNAKLTLLELVVDEQGEPRPYRWDWAKKEQSDLDIFIDDSQNSVLETRKLLPNALFVMPDYKTNEKVKGSNIYHVKTTISDLKDEDFKKAIQEHKSKVFQEKAQEGDWINIHPNFTNELIWAWQNLHFTHFQVQEWANALDTDFNPQDYAFIYWLQTTKHFISEQVPNQVILTQLKKEYQEYLEKKIEISPK